MIKNIDLKNLDKSSWKTFRFDEIAQKISERVKPDKTDLKVYVGLEHLDAESIHIKRTGVPADVKGEKLKCYPGDVIFGKRRAYQRKAAIATFEGICSGHSFVFRANSDVIDSKLFPFFLHSDQFMHRMINISVGGLSPTINWGDLKGQEFLLPPKVQQAQLAELLWAMDEVVEKEVELLGRLEKQKLTTSESFLTGKERIQGFNLNENYKESRLGLIPVSWKLYRLKDILVEAKLGGNYPNSETNEGLPLIKMGNLSRGHIKLNKIQYIPNNHEYDFNDVLQEGDLLFNTRNTLELVGKVAIWHNELPKALYNSNILRFKFDEKIIGSNQFMNLVFNSRKGIGQLRSFATGTTSVAAIYSAELMRFRCVIPPIKEQNKIVEKIQSILTTINSVQDTIAHSKALQKSLINQIF